MLWLAVAIAAFGGGVVHTITGFGAGIVMMAIMPYFLGMIEAPAISSIMALLQSLLIDNDYCNLKKLRNTRILACYVIQ